MPAIIHHGQPEQKFKEGGKEDSTDRIFSAGSHCVCACVWLRVRARTRVCVSVVSADGLKTIDRGNEGQTVHLCAGVCLCKPLGVSACASVCVLLGKSNCTYLQLQSYKVCTNIQF